MAFQQSAGGWGGCIPHSQEMVSVCVNNGEVQQEGRTLERNSPEIKCRLFSLCDLEEVI